MSQSQSAAAVSASKTKSMVIIALMAAVICVLGPLSISIPVSPVPISLANLAILFTVYVLGMKRGTISCLLYLLLGLVGLPVFSGFSGGAGKLLGPTGGYLIGYIFLALICGYFIDHFQNRAIHFIGMVLGTLVLYLFGTAWLAYLASMTFGQALAAGVIPFSPGDLAKIVIAMIAGPAVRKSLARAGITY